MAKYSYEFKKQVVKDYIEGKGGYRYLRKKYRLSTKAMIKQWVDNYQLYGEEGLKRSRKSQEYSFEYKLHVVECYMTSEISYRELARQEGLTNRSLLVRWVNAYRREGLDALRSKKKGRKRLKNQRKKKPVEKDVKQEFKKDYAARLEEENLRLRIENDFLKELRRLRLEEEKHLKRLRELSTVSEEDTD